MSPATCCSRASPGPPAGPLVAPRLSWAWEGRGEGSGAGPGAGSGSGLLSRLLGRTSESLDYTAVSCSGEGVLVKRGEAVQGG